MTHFWEDPSMLHNFIEDIGTPLMSGDGPAMPSIWSLWADEKGSRNMFEVSDENEIHVAIMTPRNEDSADPKDYRYREQVDTLSDMLVGDGGPFEGQGEAFIW